MIRVRLAKFAEIICSIISKDWLKLAICIILVLGLADQIFKKVV